MKTLFRKIYFYHLRKQNNTKYFISFHKFFKNHREYPYQLKDPFYNVVKFLINYEYYEANQNTNPLY